MTTAAHNNDSQLCSHLELAGGTYDPDDVVPHDSPLMKPHYPKLRPSPSPPPDIPPAQVSLSPPLTDGPSKSNRQHKIRPSSGDAVLVAHLDDGRRPEIARAAGRQPLATDDEQAEDDGFDDYCEDDDDDGYDDNEEYQDKGSGETRLRPCLAEPGPRRVPDTPVAPVHLIGRSLQHLAAGALKAVAAEATHEIAASTRQLSIRDGRRMLAAPTPPINYLHRTSSRSSIELGADRKPPPIMLTPSSGELPPLLDSPRSEVNGRNLPSISSALGDIKSLSTERPPLSGDKDRHGHGATFPRSPSAGVPRLHHMSGGHVSPPISPSEAYQRSLPSPRSLPASSPYYYNNGNGLQHRPSIEYSSSSATGETPNTEQAASTPATSTSVADRMSIDGITNPQQFGVYVCTYSGCTAAPFQTQYLLNSHANVHSSARPHYCPVRGCPRSEGGKGFKRKNEMIRHGLVHDSPGYVCPFCPDREHRYPRPDNLQRHVRVHHVDKDKDDPMLRDVLAQRSDGPSRGRRRRGVPA